MEIDIHCHQRSSDNGMKLLCLGTIQQALADTSLKHFSVGIHPWQLDDLNLSQALQALEQACVHPGLLALGECGLDNTLTTPSAIQLEAFSAQIALAERYRKPLIIHCVRAYHVLLSVKKRLAAQQIWIVHGFNGHPVIAEQLLQHGCYLSFGHALLQHKSKARTSLLQTPLERLFLETDVRIDVPIGEIYAAAAKILDLELPLLQRHIVANFHRVFEHD